MFTSIIEENIRRINVERIKFRKALFLTILHKIKKDTLPLLREKQMVAREMSSSILTILASFLTKARCG